MEEPSLVFTGRWFDTYVILLWSHLEKHKTVSHEKKKEFKDLEDLLVYFVCYYVVVGDNL
jgi:hypothetical protein